MIEEKPVQDSKEEKVELGSIGDFNKPKTTSPGMVVIWIVLIILMVGSISMRILV